MKKLLVFIAVMMLLFTKCNWLDTIDGDKNIVKKEYNLSPFTAIDIATTSSIVYKPVDSDSTYFGFEIDSNLVDYLDISVVDEQLIIKTKEDHIIEPSKFVIYTNADNLEKINISGIGDVTVHDKLSIKKLDIALGGIGDLKLCNLETDTLNLRITGTGNIKMMGKATHTNVAVTGVGNLESIDFVSKTANCTLTGVGNIRLHVTDTLTSATSGIGNIKYKGTPHVVNNSSGLSSVKGLK